MMDYLKLVIAIAIFGAGWCVNGWRLGEKITGLEAQAAVVADAVKSCKAGVDQAKRAADAAVAASGELADAAKRLKRPAEKTVERIETVIERGLTVSQANDCSWAWVQIETEARKAKAGGP